jgi:hypothetical protein
MDEFRISAIRLSGQSRLRATSSGEFYDCTTVAVRYRLNVNSVSYDPEGGRIYKANKAAFFREDRICIYRESGWEDYYRGPITRIE